MHATNQTKRPLEVIILAAGKGTRMHSSLPKILHPVGGKPMLQHVIECVLQLEPNKIHLVTGYGNDQVKQVVNAAFSDHVDRFCWVLQQQQLGTGHAVAQAVPGIAAEASCLMLYGDVPLIDSDSLRQLVDNDSTLSLLTATPSSPDGLGRILRNDKHQVVGIVEQKDASNAQLAIAEINTGIMHCQGAQLKHWLSQLGNNNSQGEYYLTDIVSMAVSDGESVDSVTARDPNRLLGVNSRADLAIAERSYQRLIAGQLMAAGVTLMDPARLDVRGNAEFGTDCVIDVNVVLEGDVTVGNNVSIGPGCVIRNSQIGDHSSIHANSVVESSIVGDRCHVGPFARLRPETRLGDQVRIGNFVEVKKSSLAEGAKVNHLAYVGDSTVGSNTNIGAGVITCNYDGANKHQTIIGDDVFVGSDSQLVAPVTIADGVTIGAGSTITRNIDSAALVLTRAPQKTLKNWRRPVKKP